jgi:hypothetical protein
MGRSLALVLLVACNGKQAPAAMESDEAAGPVFRVDVTPPAGCARGTACEARILLTALGGYKVNAEYPFKFIADAIPQVAFDGTGTFALAGKQTGTLTVVFRADAAGTLHVSGTFKLSVCTKQLCKIEEPKVRFDVPVS